jgi:flagellar M-ring protein FliF
MEQFKRVWDTMSVSQRVSIGLAAVGFVAGMMWLSSWQHESGFKPLFRGMASTEAAEAVQKLKESGVEFRLADNGGTILVPEERLDETRLALAREGLPKSGRLGFELFDAQNFGTTDFAEQINYRRALEGELERTIATISEVERARVHLTFAKDSVFTESRQAAKASVLLNLRRSANMSSANVIAIANLVAGAVEGLAPNQITILDSNGDLLNKPRGNNEVASVPSDQLEYRAAVERDLQNKLTQTLDPVLGPGKYRTGVSVDVDFSSVQESEEKWDPTSSVMASSQRTEESNTSQSAGGGIPGTQANLPDGAALRPANTSGLTRKTESTSFQTSRKVRHVDQQKGALKRITVAVLLDQEGKWQGNGADASLVLTPPAPETIEVIRNLVTNVAGLDTVRGDQITVDTLPFNGTIHQEPPAQADKAAPLTAAPQTVQDQLKDPKILGAISAGVVLLLGLVVFMMKKRGKKKPAAAGTTAALPVAPSQSSTAQETLETLSPDDLARLEQGLLESLRVQPKAISKGDTLAKYLRQEIRQNPQAAAQMLRSWLLEEGHSS